MSTTQESITYHGNCHCGRFRFDISVPPIRTAVSCACSLCKKKGSLWLVPPEGSLSVVRDDGHLTQYRTSTMRDDVGLSSYLSPCVLCWRVFKLTNTLTGQFCNVCGTEVTSEHTQGPLRGQLAVNIRAIREPYVNPFQIEYVSSCCLVKGMIMRTNAYTLLPTRPDITIVNTPEDKEPNTPDIFGTDAQHIFSCQCGKVTAELLVPIQGEEIKEDNCSSCVRVRLVGPHTSLSLMKGGWANMTRHLD